MIVTMPVPRPVVPSRPRKASLAGDVARCRLCGRLGIDERCFVKCRGEDQPACRACWEQLILDPRRVLASIVRALI